MSRSQPPARTDQNAPAVSGSTAIADFLSEARALATKRQGGRLILALDATMSRQPTWDLACSIQAEMFDAVGKAGSLAVQLVYFRGTAECRASRFVTETDALKRLMTGIDCRAGSTQIGGILDHALKENAAGTVNAVVYIGDAMEEQAAKLIEKAGALGLRGVPVFAFQEGTDPAVEAAFRSIAKLTKGAWFRFDRNSAATLAKLLGSIAVYAAGGLAALETRGHPEDRLMIAHLKGGKT